MGTTHRSEQQNKRLQQSLSSGRTLAVSTERLALPLTTALATSETGRECPVILLTQ